jgi:ABC-type sulfate transport system substrate-binding protein
MRAWAYSVMSESHVFIEKWKGRDWRIWFSWILGAAAVLTLLVFSIQSIFSDADEPVHLVVYAYSTQEEALSQGIFPAFEKFWESNHARDLTIEGVFGPSLTLAGQIVLGAPADVALLSDNQHVTYLKLGKMVEESNQPVVVFTSPMVIVTRPDNPFAIKDFIDLTKPGVRLIHADPRSSGAGAWAIFAAYGCRLLDVTSEVEAEKTLTAIWKNVKVMAPSARAALMLFEAGAGDAFVTYEQDARLALTRHVDLSIVIPSCTVVAEPVAVVVDKNVTHDERLAANDFLHYLLSVDAQNTFLHYQLRPVTIASDVFPDLIQTVSEGDLGGWSNAHQELIEDLWEREIKPNLNLELGVDSIQSDGD